MKPKTDPKVGPATPVVHLSLSSLQRVVLAERLLAIYKECQRNTTTRLDAQDIRETLQCLLRDVDLQDARYFRQGPGTLSLRLSE